PLHLRAGDGEMDEDDRGMAVAEDVAVAPTERRTGDDRGLAGPLPLPDPGGDRAEPRLAVLVGQRPTRRHLRDVHGGGERVAPERDRTEADGKARQDRRLAGAGHAHEDDRGRGRLTVAHGSLRRIDRSIARQWSTSASTVAPPRRSRRPMTGRTRSRPAAGSMSSIRAADPNAAQTLPPAVGW